MAGGLYPVRSQKVMSTRYGYERFANLTVIPAIDAGWGHAEGAEHALDLFAVFGGVVDDLKHHNPWICVVPIRGLQA